MKIPCKNCITLPICKARVNDEGGVLGLTEKCSTIRTFFYLAKNPVWTYNNSRVSQTRMFFGLEALVWEED